VKVWGQYVPTSTGRSQWSILKLNKTENTWQMKISADSLMQLSHHHRSSSCCNRPSSCYNFSDSPRCETIVGFLEDVCGVYKQNHAQNTNPLPANTRAEQALEALIFNLANQSTGISIACYVAMHCFSDPSAAPELLRLFAEYRKSSTNGSSGRHRTIAMIHNPMILTEWIDDTDLPTTQTVDSSAAACDYTANWSRKAVTHVLYAVSKSSVALLLSGHNNQFNSSHKTSCSSSSSSSNVGLDDRNGLKSLTSARRVTFASTEAEVEKRPVSTIVESAALSGGKSAASEELDISDIAFARHRLLYPPHHTKEFHASAPAGESVGVRDILSGSFHNRRTTSTNNIVKMSGLVVHKSVSCSNGSMTSATHNSEVNDCDVVGKRKYDDAADISPHVQKNSNRETNCLVMLKDCVYADIIAMYAPVAIAQQLLLGSYVVIDTTGSKGSPGCTLCVCASGGNSKNVNGNLYLRLTIPHYARDNLGCRIGKDTTLLVLVVSLLVM
jgi:hypothetical protein